MAKANQSILQDKLQIKVPFAMSAVKDVKNGKMMKLPLITEARIVHAIAAKLDGTSGVVGLKDKSFYQLARTVWALIKANAKFMLVTAGASIVSYVVDKIIFDDDTITIHLPVIGDVTEEEALDAVQDLKDFILLKLS